MSKYSFLLVSTGVFVVLLAGSFVQLYVPEFTVASAQSVEAAKTAQLNWLNLPDDEKFSQIERQMRGFDTTMTEVGYRYDELVEAVKNRNYEYAKYQTQQLLTHDGKVLTGLVLSEDELSLTLQTASETVAIPKVEIEQRKVSTVSVIPEGILQKRTHQEVRDLLAYLQGSEQAK